MKRTKLIPREHLNALANHDFSIGGVPKYVSQFSMGDYILEFGEFPHWELVASDDTHAYLRSGSISLDRPHDALWLHPCRMRFSDSIPSESCNSQRVRSYQLTLAGLTAWRGTRWAMVGYGDGQFDVFDCRTGRRAEENLPERAAVIKQVQEDYQQFYAAGVN